MFANYLKYKNAPFPVPPPSPARSTSRFVVYNTPVWHSATRMYACHVCTHQLWLHFGWGHPLQYPLKNATWLKNEFRGHLGHPQPPTFYGFQASDQSNETRRPPYLWSLGAAGGPASPRTVGPNGGSTKVPRVKKMIFSKVVPRPLGILKQVFLGRFEPVVALFGPWKIPKCLENGLFWDQKWVKNGSKTRFSKSDPRPFGMLKQVFLARFEPGWTEFSPFQHMYAPLCALRTYLRVVWWSHLELGEGCRLEDSTK